MILSAGLLPRVARQSLDGLIRAYAVAELLVARAARSLHFLLCDATSSRRPAAHLASLLDAFLISARQGAASLSRRLPARLSACQRCRRLLPILFRAAADGR